MNRTQMARTHLELAHAQANLAADYTRQGSYEAAELSLEASELHLRVANLFIGEDA